ASAWTGSSPSAMHGGMPRCRDADPHRVACRAARRNLTTSLRVAMPCGIRPLVSPMARPVSPVSPHEGEHLRVGDEYYVLASSLASRRRKHVLAHQDTFAVLDQSGDIPLALEEEMGVFFRGTRHLSQLELLAGGRPPFFLSSAVTPDNLRSVANLTNNDVGEDGRFTPRSTLSIRRTSLLCGPQLLVRCVLHSFTLGPLAMRLELRLSADFADVFQVRGLARSRRGVYEPSCVDGGPLCFGYRGLDGVRRRPRCEIRAPDARS